MGEDGRDWKVVGGGLEGFEEDWTRIGKGWEEERRRVGGGLEEDRTRIGRIKKGLEENWRDWRRIGVDWRRIEGGLEEDGRSTGGVLE